MQGIFFQSQYNMDNMDSLEENNSGKSTATDFAGKITEPLEHDHLSDTETEQEANVRPSRYVCRQQSDDEEDLYVFKHEERKKTIKVGTDHQAEIPEGLCTYDDALPYENEDKLVWDPNAIEPKEVEEYLVDIRKPVTVKPVRPRIRDDEQALYLLLQCGYNTDEALRRRKINASPSSSAMGVWSEEEYKNFESGLRNHGKDFRLIKQNNVRTRSVGELVQFYYLWKKSERHDVFANTIRLEKKKYALHPGITNYMDRFLDEQEEEIAGNRERTASPNIHCLIYADPKWQRAASGQFDDKYKENKGSDLKLSGSLQPKIVELLDK